MFKNGQLEFWRLILAPIIAKKTKLNKKRRLISFSKLKFTFSTVTNVHYYLIPKAGQGKEL